MALDRRMAILKHMFRNVLPEHVKSELKRQHLETLEKEHSWVHGELSHFNDHRLSKWNIQKVAERIKRRNAVKARHVGADEVSASTPQQREPSAPPPLPDMAAMQANVERLVAAAVSQSDRGRPGHRPSQPGSKSGS